MLDRMWYLDTPIWNQLSAENVDPDRLLKSLRDERVFLVISIELISELVAAFQSVRSSDPVLLGQRLFSYLSRYVENEIPCLKMEYHLLQAEAMTVTGEVSAFDRELSAPDYARMAWIVRDLAKGVFDAPARDLLTQRTKLRTTTRADAAEFARERRTSKQALAARVSFGAFLASINPIDVLKRLREILQGGFPQWPCARLTQVAAALLRNPEYRMAHAMVRADIYATWRAMRAGSLPRDIMNDCFHLVSASYCDLYITKDRPQAVYAPIVLRSTEVRSYDGATPISKWLLAAARPQSI